MHTGLQSPPPKAGGPPLLNNALYGTAVQEFQTPQNFKAKSILYNNEGNGTGEYFHRNNLTQLQQNVNGTTSVGRKITLDDISQNSKQRARLQKSFLDDSKVNKAVARDLMNTKPKFTVQDIQGPQSTKSRYGGDPFATKGSTNAAYNTSNGEQQKPLFDYKKTLVDSKNNGQTIEERLNRPDAEDETRSVRSEFDYTTKKKFVDMISKERKQ